MEQLPDRNPDNIWAVLEADDHMLAGPDVTSGTPGVRVAYALEFDETLQRAFESGRDITIALAKATGLDTDGVVEGNKELKHHTKDEAERAIMSRTDKGYRFMLTDAGREFLKQQLEKMITN